jgi:NADH-quinone oxidoreductase subunit F
MNDGSEIDLGFVDSAVADLGRGEDAAIAILLAIQEHYRYLPEAALRRVCEITEIPPATLAGVSTFYDRFRHRPAGEHTIRVCIGTACHVKGAGVVHDAFCRHLEIPEGEDTDAARRFTVEKVACLGCCTLAPAVQIGDVIYGHLTPATVPRVLEDYLRLEKAEQDLKRVPWSGGDGAGEVRIGIDSASVAQGSERVCEALQQAVRELGIRVRVKPVSCLGMSHQDPLVEIVRPGRAPALYGRVRPEDATAILRRHFAPSGSVRKVRHAVSVALDRALTDETWAPVTRYSLATRDTPVASFLDPQKRIATENAGQADPLDLDEYVAFDGFAALRRCLTELTPEEVIEEISRSGLRGRGGAGYPTGRKWSQVRGASGERKYLVCNGDEGDPGAFMDRMLLESHPFRVIEGLAIAAYAVGASEGVLYIREEYPLAVRHVREAIEHCEHRGLLGEGILASGFSLRLRVMQGAGAFVCGEETALLASIEGRRGTPRLRPPYPAQRGLWDSPTLVNNVETCANVPWILRNGGEAYAALGTERSRGTKVFALAGKIARGGLIEVPMGISIGRIVEEIGGGVPDDKRLKAVQIGGPSGGCLPAKLAHLSVDYEALSEAGAIMGSGGLVVLDETDCMVDIARYFLEFTQRQSCGKCTPCRIGTRRMLEILDRLCGGEGRAGDLEQLEQLAHTIQTSSLCGLGRTAPNPVLSTLHHFREEYEAHVAGRCPAGVCKAMITYSIGEECIGCTKCSQQCPADAIEFRPYERHEIDTDKCVRCGECLQACPAHAVKVE